MTAKHVRTVLTGARVVDPLSGIDENKDLLIEGTKIAAIDKPGSFNNSEGVTLKDLSGKVICPGFVDIHVHLRDPGQEWKETIHSGAEAAVAGGFTDVCCMPNTKPINDSKSVTEYILDRAKTAAARIHPIGAISIQSKGEMMAPFAELSAAGCVAFSDDGRPVMNSQLMRRSLEYCKMLGKVLTVHEEDLLLSESFVMNESSLSIAMGLKGMPDAAENVMIARDIELSKLTGGRVHFCHVSTARGVTLIRRAKEDGIPVTAEVTPHHIFLDENEVRGFNTQAKMSMPLRSKHDIEALIQGLNDGVIDCVASDHAPHETDSKNIEFDRASFGMLGFQTTVPILLALYHDKKITMSKLVSSLTSSAWKCLDIKPKRLAAENVADITVIDPELRFQYSLEVNKSKSVNSPLFGREFRGAAVLTIVNGEIRYEL